MTVARIMKSYEDNKFSAWKEHVENTLMAYLKRNLLVRTLQLGSTVPKMGSNMTEQTNASTIAIVEKSVSMKSQCMFISIHPFSTQCVSSFIFLNPGLWGLLFEIYAVCLSFCPSFCLFASSVSFNFLHNDSRDLLIFFKIVEVNGASPLR